MSSSLGIKARKVESILRRHGFVAQGNGNGHGVVYAHSDGRRTTIGKHYPGGVIPRGTLHAIEAQTQLKFNESK